MQFSPPASLDDLCAFILGDHSLHLGQQIVLRGVSSGAIDELDSYTVRPELLEQEHLVCVAPGKTIRAVNMNNVDLSVRNSVAQLFERRAD